ncbi:hypothetical protein CS0771_40300 [Catellatospora sp. IY07-71]|uniref:hypothetical protein n=1 Tax=Catellatospora sp. IY07-71 TaxID=2728827 RepID=UPI001BB39346|nr:hypothetical protein [Catellatospora sp. IY07-71]BCJ74486.1 hypothetical protein CS0771_40300 [Catellatospora sp. IY07-71]
MTSEDEDIKQLLTGAVPPLAAPEDRVGAVARRVGRQRRRLLAGSTFAVVLAVGLGFGGIRALGGGTTTVPALGASVDPSRWVSCEKTAPEQGLLRYHLTADEAAELPRLDDGFVPVAVVLCGQEQQRRPDGGEDMMGVERRGEDVAAIVAALRLPDEPAATEGPCFAMISGAPWLAVIDADGRWTRPGIPLGRCRASRQEFTQALRALQTTTVATWSIREVISAEAAASGCSESYKDVIAIQDTTESSPRSGTPKPFPSGPVRVCVYEVAQGRDAVGEFSHGTVLPEDRRGAIEQALLAAGPPKPCNEHASRFAVVHSVSGFDPQHYVELGGCHRIMSTGTGGTVFAQGEAALAELLDKP